MRIVNYRNKNVVIFLFSLVDPQALVTIETKYLVETRTHCKPHPPFLLVGTKQDLRDDTPLVQDGKSPSPVTSAQGEAKAKELGAEQYLEISSISQRGFDQLRRVICEIYEASQASHAGPADGDRERCVAM
jgi:GTPase SAR1 family protein